MAHLKQQFKDALGQIEPGADKANAPEAHKLVRAALEADRVLASCGIDPVLIGSYKRNVSIKRVKDVDVFGRMPDIGRDVTATQILDRFFQVLNDTFGRDDDGHLRTKRQDRSLQVFFPEYDLHVDAVPARPYVDGETWEIPQKGDENKWVRTNPEELTTLSTAMNDEHDAFYVPTVKLLRQARRALLGENKKPGGFFVEVTAYQAFKGGMVTGNDHAEYFTSALRAVSNIIGDFVDFGSGITDPTLPGSTINIRATENELLEVKRKFSEAASSAEEALAEEDEGKAAITFRKILGKNGDDTSVFPMPPGFNEDGSKRASSITAGESAVPAGSKNFA